MVQRLIKTEADYESGLARLNTLMDASPDTPEFEELELLSAILEIYEKANYPIDPPDPIEAIKFRMEQLNLQNKDLAPLLGGRSKVSEILSGKRSLTLSMIRTLHEKLKVPAEILLQESTAGIPNAPVENPEKLPWKSILERNWVSSVFRGSVDDARDRAVELSRYLFRNLDLANQEQCAHFYRKNVRVANSDKLALLAWTTQVVNLASESIRPAQYRDSAINEDFMRSLVSLSTLDEGPRLAKEYLAKNGILLIIEKHLPRTHLDGAAIRLSDGTPVIGLSLRHDRLDNFWFTLCHELAHVKLHLKSDTAAFFVDDLDVSPANNKEESEADNWAQNMLIPPDAWAEIRHARTQYEIEEFSRKFRINAAIIAGRLRRHLSNYKLFSGLVGHGCVQKQFDFF